MQFQESLVLEGMRDDGELGWRARDVADEEIEREEEILVRVRSMIFAEETPTGRNI